MILQKQLLMLMIVTLFFHFSW